MASSYTASDIEVLSGLDPVRRRPGMYTDTTRPNHLAHEVVDNSVDEALAGHCENIRVTVFKDGSLQVEDDGRGMPVDIHPKEKIMRAACTGLAYRSSMRCQKTWNAGCAAAARSTT
jgi:topoisomerase-4 subunit B